MRGPDITLLPNRASRLLCLFFLLVWSLAAGSQAPPQEPTKPATPPTDKSATADQQQDEQNQINDQGVFVFKKDVDEVMLHATVVDDRQRIITNLDKTAFTVYEDGKPQDIISFHHIDIPVAMGVVIDNSGSMREKRAKVNQAALNLVRSSNPKDEVFVVNFNDEQYLDQDFTNNLLKLKEALDKIDARPFEAKRPVGEESYLRGHRRGGQRQQRDAGAGGKAVANREQPGDLRHRHSRGRRASPAR
jgi:VWFA-related protein